MKYTNKQIIKALECCTVREMDCADCPNKEQDIHCVYETMKSALDLIKHLQEENEHLEKLLSTLDEHNKGLHKYIKQLKEDIETAKSEARKEFVERLKERSYHPLCTPADFEAVATNHIDNLLKEMENENE